MMPLVWTCPNPVGDSEMISYGKVFVSRGEIYMTYNGNNFGRTGFGLARLSQT